MISLLFTFKYLIGCDTTHFFLLLFFYIHQFWEIRVSYFLAFPDFSYFFKFCYCISKLFKTPIYFVGFTRQFSFASCFCLCAALCNLHK